MSLDRRMFLEPAAGVSAAGLALALSTGIGDSDPAGATPPPGNISFAWFWGLDQTIPNDGAWHSLTWPNPPVADNDGYFASANPTRINLVQGGLYNMIAEVAWTPNAVGVRGLRILQGGFVIAQAPFVPGIDPAMTPPLLPTGEMQHQQVVVQPGGNAACIVQVFQSSNTSLVSKRTVIGSPSMMIARLGTI